MKLLIVDNHDSFTYNLMQIVEQSGLCSFHVIKNDMIDIQAAGKFDKILISPGPGLPQQTAQLLPLIGKYYKTKSILGVCLGHQAMALFFGGRIVQMQKPVHGKVTKTIRSKTESSIYKSVPKQFNTVRYHSWEVEPDTLPNTLLITALANDGSIMSLKHKNYAVEGVQYHPESVKTEYGQEIISNWLRYG